MLKTCIILGSFVVLLVAGLPSPQGSSSGCAVTCKSSSCEVRRGYTMGSCFLPPFSSSCSGLPSRCGSCVAECSGGSSGGSGNGNNGGFSNGNRNGGNNGGFSNGNRNGGNNGGNSFPNRNGGNNGFSGGGGNGNNGGFSNGNRNGGNNGGNSFPNRNGGNNAPCQTLRVTFKNEVLLKQEEQQGRYERSTDINGRPSWIHTNNLQAIWYNPSLKRWAIGRLSDIGTEIRGISGYLRDAPTLPYETTSWEFWTDRTFDEDTIDENADFVKESAIGDTSVQCVGGSSGFGGNGNNGGFSNGNRNGGNNGGNQNNGGNSSPNRNGGNNGNRKLKGRCFHSCNPDDSCTTQYDSVDGRESFEAGCSGCKSFANGNKECNDCYNRNDICSDCNKMWPGLSACGASVGVDVFHN